MITSGKKWLILLLVATTMLQAADRATIDRGIRYFKRGAYEKSLELFREAYDSEDPDKNVYAAISLFMIIRSNYELGHYEDVFSDSRRFEQLFPDSRYLHDVRFDRARALAKEERYYSALLSAVNILSSNADEELKNEVRNFCEDLSRYYMDMEDYSLIEPLVAAGDALNHFTLLRISRQISEGHNNQARRHLQELREKELSGEDLTLYRELRSQLSQRMEDEDQESEINIAVLLPLSGAYSNTGNEILDGMKLAYEIHRKDSEKRYNMIIVDTESSVKKGLINLKNLLKIQKISAVLGPLNSDMAISMAPVCEYAGIPMITPTATADELTRMGSSIFQLNPEQRQRARALADFATDSLQYGRFAIIAPSDDYGIDIATAFTQRIERNGAQLVQQIWYNGTPTDINDKLAKLKEEAEHLPPYFSYLKGFYEARAAGFFDPEEEAAGDSSYASALDSIFTDSLHYADENMDSLYAIRKESEPEDTVFLLESLWPDNPEIYKVILRESSNEATISDSLIDLFIRRSSRWLSDVITLEEKYNTEITDSLCLFLDAVRQDTLPDWMPKMLAEYELLPIDSTYLTDFYFAPLGENRPLNIPYIDLALVDSVRTELTTMDSISALWLLAETDTVLFPYIFPFHEYGIDAVYVPIPQHHIQYIAPQWARNRFDAHLLGDGNWYNTSLLERYKSNIDSMIIASDYYWDSRGLALRRFARDFVNKTGKQPNRIHIYGYESMELLMQIIEDKGADPADIRDGLMQVEGNHGIIRNITFSPENPRSSSGVRLINFYKGKLSLIR
jgi:ABC-type branched-subunit amino acid transport system substrate-binding protein